MQSLADGLPSEIADKVHPRWRKNELDYWQVRDVLLNQFKDQWIAFDNGKVVANGRRPVIVMRDGRLQADHPFVTCVGREREGFKMRRSTFAYDSAYHGEPLPVMEVEFRTLNGVAGLVLDQVIADTGSDTSALPWSDCQRLQLDPADGEPGMMSGVAGGSASTLGFLIWVLIDGSEHPCHLHADFVGSERLLGRDVLNSLEVLFRGPSGVIVVNP